MIGVPKSEPKTPGFVTVKVPPWISSGFSRFVRARSARSCVARARPRIDFSSAFLMTGTIRPQSSATAMPRWMSLWYTMLSPSIEALTCGNWRRAWIAARKMKGRYVSLTPFFSRKASLCFCRIRAMFV